jgi:hypothetical protein
MDIRDWVAQYNEDAMLADGFDEAIIGMAERATKAMLVVYDAEKCIDILMKRDRMTRDDAAEFFMFNTAGAWMGDLTPLFLWRRPRDP